MIYEDQYIVVRIIIFIVILRYIHIRINTHTYIYIYILPCRNESNNDVIKENKKLHN